MRGASRSVRRSEVLAIAGFFFVSLCYVLFVSRIGSKGSDSHQLRRQGFLFRTVPGMNFKLPVWNHFRTAEGMSGIL